MVTVSQSLGFIVAMWLSCCEDVDVHRKYRVSCHFRTKLLIDRLMWQRVWLFSAVNPSSSPWAVMMRSRTEPWVLTPAVYSSLHIEVVCGCWGRIGWSCDAAALTGPWRWVRVKRWAPSSGGWKKMTTGGDECELLSDQLHCQSGTLWAHHQLGVYLWVEDTFNKDTMMTQTFCPSSGLFFLTTQNRLFVTLSAGRNSSVPPTGLINKSDLWFSFPVCVYEHHRCLVAAVRTFVERNLASKILSFLGGALQVERWHSVG